MFRPANLSALSAASDPGERARSFALMRLAVNAGMSVGPTVGGFLAASLQLAVLGGRHHLDPRRRPALLRLPGRSTPRRPSIRRRVRAGSPFRDRPVMAILAMMFVLNIATFQVISTFPLSLRDLYGFSEAWIGSRWRSTR